MIENFLYGFSFGMGFIVGFLVITIVLIAIIGKMAEHMSNDKLDAQMLADYLDKLIKANSFEEAADFKKYIESFNNKESMVHFFKKYRVESKINFQSEVESNKENHSPFDLKVIHFIVKK